MELLLGIIMSGTSIYMWVLVLSLWADGRNDFGSLLAKGFMSFLCFLLIFPNIGLWYSIIKYLK